MTDPPAISVVVPVRDGADVIDQCLRSIVQADYPAECREIIVVDNGSRDRTVGLASAHPVRIVREPRRVRSHARNLGIRESSNELIAFTDADCVVDTRWLRCLAAGFEEGVTAVAGEIHALEPQTSVQRFMARREHRWQRFVLGLDRPFAITSNVAFRRRALEEISGFDPFVTSRGTLISRVASAVEGPLDRAIPRRRDRRASTPPDRSGARPSAVRARLRARPAARAARRSPRLWNTDTRRGDPDAPAPPSELGRARPQARAARPQASLWAGARSRELRSRIPFPGWPRPA